MVDLPRAGLQVGIRVVPHPFEDPEYVPLEALAKLLRTAFGDQNASELRGMLPAYAHAALSDYICYRHLSSGNLAKQSRAQFYQNSFYQEMNRIRPQGMGSVTRMRNLYEATDVRYRR